MKKNGCQYCGAPVKLPPLIPGGSLICISCLTMDIEPEPTSPTYINADTSITQHLDSLGDVALPKERMIREDDRYQVKGLIAKGGMGHVYTAEDLEFGRDIAWKVLQDETYKELFENEAIITAQLQHPNIVPVHDKGTADDGNSYYLMKKVNGGTLQNVLRALKAGHRETLEIFTLTHLLHIYTRVCEAVAFAHAKGVIHRDLKPGNIMIGDFGEVLVVDWGLAKKSSPINGGDETLENQQPSRTSKDSGGRVIGTPGYMAPEQIIESADVDPRCDIYALGALLYEILTLNKPVDGTTHDDLLNNTVRKKIIPLTHWARTPDSLNHLPKKRIPISLGAIAMKALAFEPAERYAHADALIEDVNAFLNGHPTEAEQASLRRQLSLFFMRFRKQVLWTGVTIGTAAGILIIFLILLSWQITLAEESKARAIRQSKKTLQAAIGVTDSLNELKEKIPAFLAQAETAISSGNLDEAESLLGHAVNLNPSDSMVRYRIGCLLLAQLYIADAIKSQSTLQGELPSRNRRLLNFCKSVKDIGDRVYLAKSVAPFLVSEQAWPELRVLLPRLHAPNIHKQVCDKLLQNAGWDYATTLENNNLTVTLNPLSSVDDFSSLHNMNIHSLTIVGNTVMNGSSLPGGMPLRRLTLRESGITDLLHISQYPIHTLDISNQTITHLNTLQHGVLRELSLNAVPITDLSALKNFNLDRLDIRYSDNLVDITGIRGLSLHELTLRHNRNLNDISAIDGLPLQRLDLSGTGIKNISPLHHLSLRILALNQLKVTDFSPLSGLPLEKLELRYSLITNLNALEGMPLQYLDLSYCKKLGHIDHLSEFPLRYLGISHMPLKDISVLKKHKTLRTLAIDDRQAASNEIVESIKEIPNLRKVIVDGRVIKHYSNEKFLKLFDKAKLY